MPARARLGRHSAALLRADAGTTEAVPLEARRPAPALHPLWLHHHPRPPVPRRPRARPRPRRCCAASALLGESRRRCRASPALPAPPEPALRGLWWPRGPRRAGGLSGAPLRRARPRGAEEGCRSPPRPRRGCPAPGPPPPVPWRSARAWPRLGMAVGGPAAAGQRFGASRVSRVLS